MYTDIFTTTSFNHSERVEDGVKRIYLDSIRIIEFTSLVTAAFAALLGAALSGVFATGFSSPGLPVTQDIAYAVVLVAVAMFCLGVLVLELWRKKKQVRASSYSPHVYLEDGKGGILCSPSGEIVLSGLVQRAGEHIVLKADPLLEIEIFDHRSEEFTYAQFRIPTNYENQFSVGRLQTILRESDSSYPLTLRVEETIKEVFLIPSQLQHVSGQKFSVQVDHVLPPITIGEKKE